MGKKSPSPPPAPDPRATAAAQSAANIDAARATANINRVNQYTPFGSVTYSPVGVQWDEAGYLGHNTDVADAIRAGRYVGTGLDHYREHGMNEGRGGVVAGFNPNDVDRWESRINLDPRAQSLVDQLYGTLGQSFDLSTLPGYSDAATNRQSASNALFGRINPQLEQQRTALDTRLRNQGLTPGSEAWNTSMREYAMSENDARLAVDAQAGQEMAQTFNVESARRQQTLQEMLAQRQMPLNEILALMGGTQVQGGNGGAVQVAPADYTSAVGMNQAAQQQAYQGQVANVNANNTAAAGAATAAVTAAAIIA
jgi:hypothetical protein